MENQNKAFEAFKKGDFDAYPIYTSSIWMMKTDFDAVKKGWVLKQKNYNWNPWAIRGSPSTAEGQIQGRPRATGALFPDRPGAHERKTDV